MQKTSPGLTDLASEAEPEGALTEKVASSDFQAFPVTTA